MNKLNFRSLAVLALSTVVLAACGGGSEDAPSEGGGSGAVAFPASLKGKTFQRCELLTSSSGTSLNGKAIVKYLSLATNGTYSYSVWYSDGTGCSGQAGTSVGAGQTDNGSEDVFRYNQSGTYTTSSMAADGSYEITFTITGNTFTARNFGSMGPAMASAVNTNCNLTLSGGGQQTMPSNHTCLSTNTNYIVPTPPVATLVIKQRLELAGRGITIGSFSDIYTPGFVGNSTAPTSVSVGLWTYL